jgi:small-conductance mechanosensitive channel
MRKITILAVVLSILLLFTSLVLALGSKVPGPKGPSDTEACAACGGLSVIFIGIPLVVIVLNIVLLVWVARDAKSRGMDSAVLWMVLVMFTSLIGLIIYIFSRPQGNLVKCKSCGNKRLQVSAKCPHCGNA